MLWTRLPSDVFSELSFSKMLNEDGIDAAVVFTANFTLLQSIMGKNLEEQIGD